MSIFISLHAGCRGDQAMCALDFAGENYCKDTLSFAIHGVNRAELICTTWSFCSVCCYIFSMWKMVGFRKVTDMILSVSSHVANRIEPGLNMLEVVLHLQHNSNRW